MYARRLRCCSGQNGRCGGSWRRIDGKDAAALAHGNRGRTPAHTIPETVRDQVRALRRGTYAGVNDQHFTEWLAERDGIQLSRSTVRRIRQVGGEPSPKTRRPPPHRQRRERMAQAGMLVQWDGSQHAWREDRGPRLTLLAATDEATNTVLAAHFRAREDAHGYLQLLADRVTQHGHPLAGYPDRHRMFRVTPAASVEEQRNGQPSLTQMGRALADFAITSIAARSPQAKGRIERLLGTLQDRLVTELRLANATTMTDAKAPLPAFNQRFRVPASNTDHAFRPLEPRMEVAGICSFRYVRRVGLDNTVALGEHRRQRQTGPRRFSYARALVEVQERLDGSLVVVYQGQEVARQSAPREAPVLRARQQRLLGSLHDRAEPLLEEHRGDLVVDEVDWWAGAAAAVHQSTPRPASTHPGRRGFTGRDTFTEHQQDLARYSKFSLLQKTFQIVVPFTIEESQ